MNAFQTERQVEALESLAVSFSRIADALEGLNGQVKSAGNRYWPEPREPKEAVVSRIPTEEDKAKENQGMLDESIPIDAWLDLGNPEELWGEREREWHRTHPKSEQETAAGTDASPIPDSGQESGGVTAAEGEIGTVGDSAPDNTVP
jgi:hypothetical protein